jgi:hypothetical protein
MSIFTILTTGDLHTKFSFMAPRNAFKAAFESSGQVSNVVFDTSPPKY